MNRDKIKTVAIHVALALALLAVGYGAGRLQGLWAAGAAKQACQDRVDDARQGHAALQRDISAREKSIQTWRHRAGQLEARRELARVLMSLDERNFGIAQGFLSKSADLLRRHGAEGEDLVSVSRKVAKSRVVVAGNLKKQRANIQELAEELDGILDRHGEAAASIDGAE